MADELRESVTSEDGVVGVPEKVPKALQFPHLRPVLHRQEPRADCRRIARFVAFAATADPCTIRPSLVTTRKLR